MSDNYDDNNIYIKPKNNGHVQIPKKKLPIAYCTTMQFVAQYYNTTCLRQTNDYPSPKNLLL